MAPLTTVDLGIHLPAGGLGVVVMQPFVPFNSAVPQQWPETDVAHQLDRIGHVLSLATRSDHGAAHTHFTIFPEYTLPGLEAVRLVQTELDGAGWPTDSIVIGGMAGLTPDEYRELCGAPCTVEPMEGNRPSDVRADQWVNCCVVWAKSDVSGQGPTVRRYVQPKLLPCILEQLLCDENMFQGKGLYVFKTHLAPSSTLHFMCVLCYDWIARHEGCRDTGVLALLDCGTAIDPNGGTNRQPAVDMVFLLEHNPKPNADVFLSRTMDFFTRHVSYPPRDRSMVFVANTAGHPGPGRCQDHGFSGIVCHPHAPFLAPSRYDRTLPPPSYPSYATCTTELRNNNKLHTCIEALFRENGECVHTFKLVCPSTVEGVSGDHVGPIPTLNVHPIDAGVRDPRLAGAPIPAIVKWTNDEVDGHSVPQRVTAGLQPGLQQSLQRAISEVRQRPSQTLKRVVLLGTAGLDTDVTSVDEYGPRESAALDHAVRLMSIADTLGPAFIAQPESHVGLNIEDRPVEVTSVYGPSHLVNIEHLEQHLGLRRSTIQVVFSRGTDGFGLLQRDRDITKPKRRFAIEDYIKLNDLVQTMNSPEDLADNLRCLIHTVGMEVDDRIT